ncbi:MAG: OmpA family protein [Xanthomonadales bacterium]|nr:OmpA family protein [Xanthomonadales bacterium]
MKTWNSNKKLVATLLCSALAVSACKTIDPYTGEEKVSNTTKGAAIGAAAGVVIGAISGDDSRERKKRILIGAGVGALAGGGVGAYMDKQEAELRRQLAGTGVSVTRMGDDIVLNMPGNITFATNQAAIDADFYPVLDSVALVVNEYEKTLIEVVGHTDSTGTDEINQPLSERRASSVGAYLRSQNVMSQRISTYGVGSRYPVANNDTQSGRALNRRVEITLLPLTQ